VRISRRGAIGIVISIALLWWTLRDVQFAELWHVVRVSDPIWWVCAIVAATCTFPLRALRWRLILDPVAPGIPLGSLWRATAIGMMVNNLLPARAGELARALALTRETPRVGFAAAFASLAVDRVFDAVVLLLLLIIGIYDLPDAEASQVGNWVGGFTLLIVAVIAALYLVVVFPARIIGLYEALARRVAPRFEARGRDLLLAFASGLSVLRSPRRFAAVFAWTTIHWMLNALAFWLGFRAVGIEVSAFAALVVQGIVAIGVAAPSSPGFFGIFEAVARLTLVELYGVHTPTALAWAFGYHILTFIPITLFGLFYIGRIDMRLGDVQKVEPPDSDTPGTSAAGPMPLSRRPPTP
jgi:uncharacterized protein (TIRG00374 family)